jgi:uncharacterized protein (TIGR02145 family)
MRLPNCHRIQSVWRTFLALVLFLICITSLLQAQNIYYIKDSRDGTYYKVVYIGEQWWMAQNLNVGTRIDLSLQQSNNHTIEKYCYNNLESNCNIYGGFYQWDELMQYGNVEFNQGICPSGWHVSSDGEWKILENYIGMSVASIDSVGYRGFIEGGKLKSIGTQYWLSPNTAATNSTGFSALPAGYRDTAALSVFSGSAASFWNADTYTGLPYYRLLFSNSGKIGRLYTDKRFGASVRCIKDSPYMFGRSKMTDARDGKVYNTVLIANHWWMAENLNVGNRIDHTTQQGNNNSIQKYCYNDLEANCDTFGGLYQWDELMQFNAASKQGICPDGWHVPTDDNWKELEWASGFNEVDLDYTDGRGGQGNFLRKGGGSGFDALHSGAVLPNGSSTNLGSEAFFWTSSEGYNSQVAWARKFIATTASIYRDGNYYKQNAMSVRCVRNDNLKLSLEIMAPDTVCAGVETTLEAKSYGGDEDKVFLWWSNPGSPYMYDSIVKVKPKVSTRYYVRVIDGYVYIRDSVLVTTSPAPAFSFTGDTSVCSNAEALEYEVSANSKYDYVWDIPDNNGTINSQDENHALVAWGTAPGYRYLQVTATNKETGCQGQNTLKIVVMPAPSPEIILKGQSLFICTDSGLIYQWYHNGSAIAQATKQFYYAKNKESGSYYVETTLENQCVSRSESYSFDTKSTGSQGDDASGTIFFSPNPTRGYLSMDMINDYTGPVKLTVTNSLGQMVRQYTVIKNIAIFNTCVTLDDLAEGPYFFVVEYNNNKDVYRITLKK